MTRGVTVTEVLNLNSMIKKTLYTKNVSEKRRYIGNPIIFLSILGFESQNLRLEPVIMTVLPLVNSTYNNYS